MLSRQQINSRCLSKITRLKWEEKLYHTARVSRSTSRLASLPFSQKLPHSDRSTLVQICPKIAILALNSLLNQSSAGIAAAGFSCVHSLSLKSLLWDLWSGALSQKSSRTHIQCWGEEKQRVVWTKTLAFCLFSLTQFILTVQVVFSRARQRRHYCFHSVFTYKRIFIVIFMKKMCVVFAQTKLTTNCFGVCFCCFLCLSTKYDASLEKLTSHDFFLNL